MLKRFDIGIVVPVILLLLIGFVLVLSSSSYYALSEYNNAYYFAQRHAIFIGAGVVLMFLIRFINYKIYDSSLIFYLLNGMAIFLSVAVHFLGEERLGGQRWISLFGIEFMPVDIAKAAIVFSLAYTLTHFRASRNKLVAMMIHLLVPGILTGLTAAQPDFSSSLVLAGTTGAMMLIGFEPIIYVIGLGGLGAAGAVLFAISAPYRMERISTYLASLRNVHSAEIQIKNGIFAIATGGLIGRGPGRSIFNKLYIPHPHNDMILTTLGEEYGFVGMVIVFGLFLLLIMNIIRLAISVKNPYGKYFCFGVAMMIFFQMTVNVGSTLGLVPATGIALPFISYGGTNLLVFLALIGVVLSIDRMETKL